MTKFIKSVHGNVSFPGDVTKPGTGKYFPEGMSVGVEDEFTLDDTVKKMVSSGHLKIFDSEEKANAHTFRSMSERFLAGEDVSAPPVKETEKKVELVKNEVAPFSEMSQPPSDSFNEESQEEALLLVTEKASRKR